MSWPEAMRVVEVDWLDSHAETGWQSRDDWRSDEMSMRCRTVGWLYHDDAERLVLTQSFSEQGQMDNLIHIPRCAVLGVVVLWEPAA